MCQSVDRRGMRHHRRSSHGLGPADGDVGASDCQSGERYCPHPEAGWNGDGGNRARPAGAVPSTRGDRGGAGPCQMPTGKRLASSPRHQRGTIVCGAMLVL